MKSILPILVITLLLITNLSSNASIVYNSDSLQWKLVSNNIEYIISHKNNTLNILYWGEQNNDNWKKQSGKITGNPDLSFSDLHAIINGIETSTTDYIFEKYKIEKEEKGIDCLYLNMKHKTLPILVTIIYKTFGETGVMSRQLNIKNIGNSKLEIQNLPSLSIDMPLGNYVLQTLESYWGNERNLITDTLPQTGSRVFKCSRGTSTSDFASWFCLQNTNNNTRYLAQLAYSGNWQMSFTRQKDYWKYKDNSALSVEMGIVFDHYAGMELQTGQSFLTPEVVFTCSTGNLDEIANQMHHYQRNYVVPANPANNPLLVVYNTWYGYPLKVDVETMKKSAEKAAELGCELFMLDAGWYNVSDDWTADLGNWTPVKESFPNGIEELANYVRSKKMKFGLWVEIENVGSSSSIIKEHPEWTQQLNGKPLNVGGRYLLNYANPQAWKWAFNTLQRLINDYKLDWLKIDFNASPGIQFDNSGQKGLALYNHMNAYYKLLDTVRFLHPNLIIENCASGAMRQDLSIMAHTNTSWVSDNIHPKSQPQLAWGATLELIPEICTYFITGDTTSKFQWLFNDKQNTTGWWDYVFKISMIGQYGVSSDLTRWSPEVMECGKRNINLYKQNRSIIIGADVYHLTPMPDHFNPEKWSVLQYYNPLSSKHMIMAYRLKNSNLSTIINPEKIAPDSNYNIIFEDGKMISKSGKEIIKSGIEVKLANEFNATLIILEPK